MWAYHHVFAHFTGVGLLTCLHILALNILGHISWGRCKSHSNLSQSFSRGVRSHITPHLHLKITSLYKMVSACGFTYIFMITNEGEHNFICSWAIHISFFVKMLMQAFDPFFFWVIFLPENLLSWIIILYWFCVLQIFSSLCKICFSLF